MLNAYTNHKEILVSLVHCHRSCEFEPRHCTFFFNFIISTFFSKAKTILLLPLSINLSIMLSPPKPIDKINQIWGVSYSHD